MGPLIAQALELWRSPEVQEFLRPLLVLSSISGMFWLLARLAGLLMYLVHAILPDDLSGPLAVVYNMVLALGYATMMFYTALLGRWHPSLMVREMSGFVFMYLMLGAAYTDRSTRRINRYAKHGFVLGLLAYLFFATIPSWMRHPALVEFHRILELLAQGGLGYVMTALTLLCMVWSFFTRGVGEIAFALSPICYRLGLIKAPLIRFRQESPDEEDETAASRREGVVPTLRRALLVLALLLVAGTALWLWWPRLRARAGVVAPAIQSQVQSPEAASAAADLRRVLPEISFTAVRTLARRGPVAQVALPVFRRLLTAPAEQDRLLAAAALDRMDPDFHISALELFRSTDTPAWNCAFAGRRFQVLVKSLPGDDPVKSRTFWIADGRGVHFTGLGPGPIQEVSAASGCAVAVFGSREGALLLAFTEPTRFSGSYLWLTAYQPQRQEVLDAARVGENAGKGFALLPAADRVSWAEVPANGGGAACRGDCGPVLDSRAVSLANEALVEYRSASVLGGVIKAFPEPEQTFAQSGLDKFFFDRTAFERAFRFDPAMGFLTRWYRLAKLADGRECLSVSLDPSWPGMAEANPWHCVR